MMMHGLPTFAQPLPFLPPPASLLPAQFQPMQSQPMQSQIEAVGPVQTAALANGATGHFLQMPNQQRSVLNMTLPLNSVPPGVEGLVMSLIDEGSEATKQRVVQLRNQGIRVGVFRMDDRLLLRVSGPAGQEAELAQAALGLLTKPVVDPATLNTTRANHIQTLQGQLASPDTALHTAMNQKIYGPGHLFSLSPQERIAKLASQNLPSVLSAYNQMLQSIKGASMMMASPQPASVQQQVVNDAIRGAGWFHNPYAGGTSSASLAALPNPQGTAGPVLVPNEALQRALIKVSWKAPDVQDPDYPAYRLFKDILHGTTAGSFFDKLRTQHGLVYGVEQMEGNRLAQGNCYNVGVEVGFDKIGLAINDLTEVGQTLCQAQVGPAILDVLKRKSLLQFRDMLQETDGAAALYQPWMLKGAQPPDIQRLQAALNQVTPADIQRVANRMFNPQYGGFRLLGVSAPTQVLRQWFPGQI